MKGGHFRGGPRGPGRRDGAGPSGGEVRRASRPRLRSPDRRVAAVIITSLVVLIVAIVVVVLVAG
ncbi:MAG TPA: hypothetical protein VFJ14_13440 [Nocardioidaceae bacterium]|nr:hypothetical protein [Nocardioidaceae bacterium]